VGGVRQSARERGEEERRDAEAQVELLIYLDSETDRALGDDEDAIPQVLTAG
jgi:hypothetical protein